MTNRKVIAFNIILFSGIVFLVGVIATDTPKEAATEMIKGFVKSREISPQEKYIETLINYYDAEPNWKPGPQLGTITQPEIIGQAGLLVDINSGNTLYEKNSTERRKIASLVKIMTATIALEHKSLNEKIYITPNAAEIGENTMGISEGEIYTLEELLYGLILHSGNDAAYAIAEGVAGDTETFVKWMNLKARELGLRDTYFADPSGLDDNTYSTPLDLVKLTRYALKNAKFKEIVATVEKDLVGTDHKNIYLYNQTNLVSTYPGVSGVKTGYTEEAGLCLVTYAENEEKEVVGVVLNSIDRKGDMILVLDHGYETLGIDIKHNLL